MTVRLTKDAWALELARITAHRATCLRRQVGCVLLNARGHVLATGYNGVAAGQPHCNESVETIVHGRPEIIYPYACPSAAAASGTQLDGCYAVHAEQNALLQCHDSWAIEACYVTVSPCITCTKLLLNTSCQRIIYAESYAHTEAQELWQKAGRLWLREKK